MKNNIKWKFNEGDVTFISPADKFDDHVRKFSTKLGFNKLKITILENGNDSTNNSAESSPATDPWESTVPKSTRTRSPKKETVQLSDLSGNVDESDSTSDSVGNTADNSSDSESSDSNAN